MHKFGKIQKKIMLALLAGMALGSSSSPKQYFNTFQKLKTEWKEINQSKFNRSIRSLSREKLIEEKLLKDGAIKLILTKEGKRQARILHLSGNSIKFKNPKKWDKKWRIVIFDIPEKDRLFRDILRQHLRDLRFIKLQNSVFISPYPFEKPILELISLYQAEKYVKVLTAIKIHNEKWIKNHFFEK